MNEPKLRVYKPGDEVGVAMVVAGCFDRFIAPGYSEEGRRNFASYIYPEAIAKRQSEDCQMFLFEFDGEIIAVLELRNFEHISMLFVASEYHGSGLATRLLERALRFLGKMNPGLKELTVYSSPYAVEFYRAKGFRPTAEEQLKDGIRFIPMSFSL